MDLNLIPPEIQEILKQKLRDYFSSEENNVASEQQKDLLKSSIPGFYGPPQPMGGLPEERDALASSLLGATPVRGTVKEEIKKPAQKVYQELFKKGLKVSPETYPRTAIVENFPNLSEWVYTGDKPLREYSEELPKEIKEKALHKLSGKTQVRINPETGEREFLLYRGTSYKEPEERLLEKYQTSSFTSDPLVAKRISNYYNGEPIQAWIPESDIRNIPNAIMLNPNKREQEIIINKFPKLFEKIKDQPENINEIINKRARGENGLSPLNNIEKFNLNLK